MRTTTYFLVCVLIAACASAQDASDREILRFIVDKHYEYRNFQMKPAFPGDEFGLRNYLNEEFRNPFPAIPDTVYYQAVAYFEIDYFGIPTKVRIENSRSSWEEEIGCMDEEVFRLFYEMPLWYPGENNGAPAKMKYVQPISITLYPDLCSTV